MESPDSSNAMSLNTDRIPKQEHLSQSPRHKVQWLLIITFLFLGVAVAGILWHDLRLAYQNTIAHWNALLTNSANDQTGMSAMWLDERRMNAEFISEDSLTRQLLAGAANQKNNPAVRRAVESELQRVATANGLQTGLVVDLQCHVVASGGAEDWQNVELDTVCKKVFQTKGFHVIASGLDKGEVQLSIAVPVFNEVKLWPSGKNIQSIAGMAVLITSPWKTLLPFFVPGSEPAKSVETLLIWKRQDKAVTFFPARAAHGEKSVSVQPLIEQNFETQVAVSRDVPFGEFKDSKGRRIFGMAKQIPLAGDHLARVVDRGEVLAEFYRRMALELFAGILVMALFGFLAGAVHRHTATKELLERLEHQEALLALKRNVEISEQRFKDIFENANDAILILDLEYRIVSMNKSAEQISGYTREEAEGRSALTIIAPESHHYVHEIVHDLLEGKKVPLHEVMLTTKDGRHVFVEVNRQLVFADGRPAGIQVIARDVTERKKAEKEIRSEKEFTDAVISSLPGAFYVINRDGRLVRWNRGAQGLGYSSEELAAMGPDAIVAEEDRDMVAAKRAQVFADGKPVMTEAQIVTKDGEKIPYLFTAERAVIDGEPYVIGMGVDIAERKRMTEALRQSDERYREFISHTAEGVWRLEFEQPIPLDLPEEEILSRMRSHGYLAECNDPLARILGMKSALDVVGARFNDLIPSGDELWNDRVRSLIRSRFDQRTLEFKFVDRLGSSKDVRRTEIPIVENGMLMRIWGITHDITRRKRAEEGLRESEERFHRLSDASFEGIAFSDAGKLIDANGKLAEMLGYEQQELIGMDVADLIAPQSRDEVLAHIQSGSEDLYENLIVRKDGTIFPVETQARYLPRKGRRIRVTAIRDITERKKAEAALRESEERFRQLAVHSPYAFFLWDVQEQRHVYVSPAYESVWGRTPGSLYINYDHWKKAIHPEDRQRMERTVLGDFQSNPEKEGVEDEFRVVHPDGSIRWVHMHRFPVRNELGEVYRIGLIAQDISERKFTEEALKESEVRYRTLVNDSLALICTHSLDGTLLSVNPAAAEIWGGSPEDLAGKNLRDFLAPQARQIFGDYLQRIQANNRDSGIMQVISRRGEKRSWLYRNILRREPGKEPFVLGFAQDITERIQAEQALVESEERFRQMADNSPYMFWLFDVKTKKLLYVSPAYEKIWGRKVEDFYANPRIWRETLHPEDRGRVTREFDTQTRSDGTESEYRIILPDGSIRWIHGRSFLLRSASGEIQRLAGIAYDVTERKQAEIALMASKASLAEAQRIGQMGSWEWNASTGTAIWSDELIHLYGLTLGGNEVAGETFLNLLHPDDREGFVRASDKALKDEQVLLTEFRIIRGDGALRYFQSKAEIIRDSNGKAVRMIGTNQDITERVHADQALRQREKELEEAQRLAQVGSWVWDVGQDSQVWSKELYRIAGRDPSLPGPGFYKDFPSRYSSDTWNRLNAVVQNTLQTGEPFELEMEVDRPETSTKWVIARGEAVLDGGGKVYQLRGTIQDITRRKLADEALRQRERELKEAQRLAKVGSWAVDLRTGAINLSEEYCHLLGIDPNGPPADVNTIARRYSPETWAHFDAAARKTNETGEPFVIEGAANLPDGSKKWLLSRGEIERDANGNPLRFRGTTQDITERKEAEEALRASQEMFYKAFHSSPEPISIMTLGEGRFIDVNKAFSDQLGYTRGEVIGHTVDELGLDPLGGLTAEQSKLWDQGELRDLEVELFTKFGEVRTAVVSFESVEIGGVPCILAQGRDITEHRRAEKALRVSDQRYRDFISHSHEGVWRIELELPIPVDMATEDATERLLQYGIFAECNDAMARMNGFPAADDVIGKRLSEVVSRSDKPRIGSYRSAVQEGWKSRQVLLQTSDAAGNTKSFLRTEIPIIENGRVVRIWGITRDVTELTEAEYALRKSEASLAEAQRIARIGSWEWDIQTNEEQWSDEMFRLLGLVPGAMKPTLGGFMEHVHPDDREGLIRAGDTAQKEKHPLQYEYRAVRNDGAVRIFHSRAELVFDPAGKAVRMVGATQDVTEQRKAQEELKVSEARYKTLIEAAPEAIVVADVDTGKFVDFNENAMHLFGMTREDLLKAGPVDVSPPVQPNGRPSSEAAADYFQQALSGDNPVFEWLCRSAYGKDIPCEVRLVRLPSANRNLVRGSIADITERMQAEEERSRLVSIVESSGDPIVGVSREGYITDWNAAAERVYGYAAEQIHGKHLSTLAPFGGNNEFSLFLDKATQGERVSDFEAICIRKDGTEFPVSATMSAIRDSQGGLLGLSAIIRDITSRKRLEEQVTLSQKMESVGRLAGGVAHDFNNMLQIIHGYSELVLDELSEEDPSRGHVQEIKNVVERAAGLTRQLLAFGRQQVMSPQVIELNVAINHLSKMLRRLIGEDIHLEIREAKNLGRVKADPGQIDQVIMNLVVNARDAMPKGGKLIIETSNVMIDRSFAQGHFPMAPGNYVMVSVIDTGIGMDAETQSRIFEPFFTTKEKGKGTGLGLATVYGIVKQSGGYIWVQSELGRGSAFRVYLPPVPDTASKEEVKEVRTLKGGTETVLLVEDEEDVRLLVRRALQAKGYTVLEAQNGKDALRVARQHQGPIHLLMTDVVMPGMGGPELSERLIRIRGEMKTLFMSGYADDSIHHQGVLNPGTELLQKPFSADVLATKVRNVLK